MSSKFSIRPAPRKRPWICKASPPTLVQPPYPPHVLASVSLKYLGPLAPGDRWYATFHLKPLSSVGPYRASYSASGNTITLTWHWGQGDATAYASANFSVGIYADFRSWETQSVTPNPYLRYESHRLIPTGGNLWSTVLVITA